MSYEKQNFKDGEKLKASQLNNMEEGIAKAGTLIITIDEETGMASHNSAQIHAHIQNGGTVMLRQWDLYIAPVLCEVGVALFEERYSNDNGLYKIEIDGDGIVTRYEDYYLNSPTGTGITIACFEPYGGDDARLCCHTHTANELLDELRFSNHAVLAKVSFLDENYDINRVLTLPILLKNSIIVVGEHFADTGWSHIVDNEQYYADGNIDNKATYNELWGEY